MKKITILSGKGGVGKSSITASLAVLLARNKKIIVADCDVDAPNLALVLGVKKFEKTEKIQTSEKAVIDYKKCISCKKCFDSCYFYAVQWRDNRPMINNMLCEGCGVCELVCHKNAIKLIKVENAAIGYGRTDYGFKIVSGQLKIGESGSGKVVSYVKTKASEIGKKENAEIMLIDSAAGIGCPVIASVTGSDYVIAVTEPTPSALSDLKRALEMVSHFKIPVGIVINRYDINKDFSKKIEKFAKREKIKILQKIAYDRKFVDALVNLKPIVIFDKSKVKNFGDILDNIPLIKEGGK
jgi:MinD superfamily P-loop ATPase